MGTEDEQERRGRLIQRLRERKLWTREKLSREAGVSLTTIIDSEEGRTQMRIGTASKIANALEVDPLSILHPPADPLDVHFERFLEEARAMDDDDLWVRGRELNRRLEKLSKDPAMLPRKLGGQASRAELAQHLRVLKGIATEARAVHVVIGERLESKVEALA